MGYENDVVFKYVNALLQGEDTGRYNIGVFVARHNQIETKLTELKNIIVKYYPSRANNNLLNTVLFDIYSCEKDLCSHCRGRRLYVCSSDCRIGKESTGKCRKMKF